MTGFEMIEQGLEPKALEFFAIIEELEKLKIHVFEWQAEMIERGIEE